MIEFRAKKHLSTNQGQMLFDVDFEIENNSVAAFFGASGAGKTTILRMIAGLCTPEAGRIVVDGDVWFDSDMGINLVPQKRSVGFVFQDYGLFPNMTVKENLTFAADKTSSAQLIEKLLGMAGLSGMAARKPDTLSGGQQQRLALVRALVRKPAIFLLDEPLCALDAAMKTKLQDLILELYESFKVTTLLVSHDVPEIIRLSQKVFSIADGKIRSSGKPEDIFVRRTLSSKFSIVGQIVSVIPADNQYILTVSAGNSFLRVIASPAEIENLREGDHVSLASKAFNPLIMKVNH